MERYRMLEAKMLAAGVSQGTIDAFSDEIRKLEDAALARILRASIGDNSTHVGRYVPADHIEIVANEIATFRA